MQTGNLHICALRFLAPSHCCLPPFPENQSSNTLICSGTQLLLHPVECPCPENYRNKPTVQPCPFFLWALMQLLDTLLCHIHTLYRRAGKICHSGVVLALSVGLLCSTRAAAHQAAKLAIWLFSWATDLFWARACEMAISGLVTNRSFPPTLHSRGFLAVLCSQALQRNVSLDFLSHFCEVSHCCPNTIGL